MTLEDEIGLNTGAVFVDSGAVARALLRLVWNETTHLTHPWGDQAAARRLLYHAPALRQHVRMLPSLALNHGSLRWRDEWMVGNVGAYHELAEATLAASRQLYAARRPLLFHMAGCYSMKPRPYNRSRPWDYCDALFERLQREVGVQSSDTCASQPLLGTPRAPQDKDLLDMEGRVWRGGAKALSGLGYDLSSLM